MTLAKGIDFVLYAINYDDEGNEVPKRIAGQRGASISFSANGDQLSVNGTTFNILSGTEWEISTDQMLSFDDDSFDYLMHHFHNRKPIMIKFMYQKGKSHEETCANDDKDDDIFEEEEETESIQEDKIYYQGLAHLMSIDINADYDNIMMYSVSLKNHFELKKYVNDELVEW